MSLVDQPISDPEAYVIEWLVLKRALFNSEHDDFRESFRIHLEREVVPHYAEWDAAGIVPREAFSEAGRHGFLGTSIPEKHGGAGVEDFRFNMVLTEEAIAADAAGFGLGMSLHNDIALPYFLSYASEEQRTRWFPGLASGDLLTAIAMTEPEIGSDLAAMTTSARHEGDHYILSGGKTFITNGINADLVIVAAKTDPHERHRGISLFVVEADTPGFQRGKNLDKLGLHAQDTAELFFDGAVVPEENLLGEAGHGFMYLVSNLAQERLSIAVSGVAAARAAVDWTVAYVKERKAFGSSIASFQNTRFTLAEAATEVDLGQVYVDRCCEALNAGELTAEDAAMAKWWCTEMQGRVIDRCLQLFGGYGYMTEYPITRAYADARVTRIYGGTTEIMKEIISRGMGVG